MLIGGIRKVSLIEYPDHISTVIFTQGCNFRCPYCFNPELVKPELFSQPLKEEEIFTFLKKRKDKLEAVVITGGEPTIQPDLLSFMKKIKDMGYLIGLETNGARPAVLSEAIKQCLLDYIAMDVKAPLRKYNLLSGVEVNLNEILESINIIGEANIKYQFRTTFVKQLLNQEDINEIHKLLNWTQHYIVQKFIYDKKILNDSLLLPV